MKNEYCERCSIPENIPDAEHKKKQSRNERFAFSDLVYFILLLLFTVSSFYVCCFGFWNWVEKSFDNLHDFWICLICLLLSAAWLLLWFFGFALLDRKGRKENSHED